MALISSLHKEGGGGQETKTLSTQQFLQITAQENVAPVFVFVCISTSSFFSFRFLLRGWLSGSCEGALSSLAYSRMRTSIAPFTTWSRRRVSSSRSSSSSSSFFDPTLAPFKVNPEKWENQTYKPILTKLPFILYSTGELHTPLELLFLAFHSSSWDLVLASTLTNSFLSPKRSSCRSLRARSVDSGSLYSQNPKASRS